MKRLLLFAGLLLLGIAIGAAGGYGVGRSDGEADALNAVGEYQLTEQGTPPWVGQGDAGFKLCLALKQSDAQKAAADCLAETGDEPVAEETQPSANTDSGSPTPQTSPTALPTVDLHITILSPAVPTQVAATPTIASSATPSPTAARPTRDGTRD